MKVESKGEVSNECGLIYSGGVLSIVGSVLRNGYRASSSEVDGVDPNKPIYGTK